ncbi:serine protease 40-like isoform X1 [Aotus nancymaae]|uniref:serine protease 40-like isoform X1 n=1 Tax=Aotus nancymaae TaxID=37293 RepID=UPI0030FF0E07
MRRKRPSPCSVVRIVDVQPALTRALLQNLQPVLAHHRIGPLQPTEGKGRSYVCSAHQGNPSACCTERSRNPSDYRILLGYNQLSHPTKHSQQMTVNEILLHADCNQSHRMGSDITLLQLHRPAEFSSRILPACLPEPTMASAPSSSCWVSGWGMVTEDGEQCRAGNAGEGAGGRFGALPVLLRVTIPPDLGQVA